MRSPLMIERLRHLAALPARVLSRLFRRGCRQNLGIRHDAAYSTEAAPPAAQGLRLNRNNQVPKLQAQNRT